MAQLPDAPTNFMHSIIPAQPGTYLIEFMDPANVTKTPIIAWAPDATNPYRAMIPMSGSGMRRVLQGMAILLPCGMVQSHESSVCFADTDEWVAFLNGAPRANDVRQRHTETGENHKVPSAPRTAPAEAPEASGEGYDISWQKEAFKTNSFWHYDDPSYEFIFQVEGGSEMPPKPTDTVVKIKRDEFMAMKKAKTVLDYADVVSGPGGAEEPEQADDEDEEAEDLI